MATATMTKYHAKLSRLSRREKISVKEQIKRIFPTQKQPMYAMFGSGPETGFRSDAGELAVKEFCWRQSEVDLDGRQGTHSMCA